MKKKFFDGLNKIKSKFENIKENVVLSPEEIKKKEIKNGVEFLINELKKGKNSESEKKINDSSSDFSKIEISPNLTNKNKQSCSKRDSRPADYYYRDNENQNIINDNPILFVAVVGFHHKKGSIIEFVYPSKEEIIKNHFEFFENCLIERGLISVENSCKKIEKILEDIQNQLTYHCLPDAVHNTNEDAQFFFIQNYKTILYGISSYRQLKTKSHEIDDDNTRDCVQKAICIVSKIPLFGHFYSKLSSTISAFFNQNTLKDKLIMQQLYANYESISFRNINTSEIFMSFSLRKILMFSKEKFFALIKLIMLEKKIVVYSHVSNHVCSFVLSLISLIPGNSLFNLSLGSSVINFKVNRKFINF